MNRRESAEPDSSLLTCTFYAVYTCHDRQELKKILEANGWRLDRISGSHHIMICEGRQSIPIPVHGSLDLPKGLVHAILKQSGVKE